MSGIMSMLLGARTAIAAAVDEFFNRVTLLLPGDGTNGAQNNTFLDSSTNNFSITRNGNATQGTFSPFSQTGWSNFFDGTGDYLSVATQTQLGFGTGDFTVECWAYITTTPVTNTRGLFHIATAINATVSGYGIGITTGLAVQFYSGNTFTTSSTTISLNTWNHFALVKSSGTVRLYVNGVQPTTNGSIADSQNFTTAVATIGTWYSTGTGFEITGYVSNFMATKGGALYTSTFTPSTTPLTTTVSAGTVSLLTCQSNRFIDNSTNAFALTVNGNTSVQAFSPFAPTDAYSAATVGGSGYFDGTGDYLTVADNTALNIQSGDFTVECWFYVTSAATDRPIICRFDGDAGSRNDLQYFINYTSAGSLVLIPYESTNNLDITFAGVSLNSWHHCALVRTGNTVYGYLDGVRNATTRTVSTLNNGAWTTYVGYYRETTDKLFLGYISNVRILKGTALYTGATYTVPTAPFAAISNTSLLFNYTNAGITDATAKNVLETLGNAQISTTQSKWGNSSMYFDGTGDYLTSIWNPANNIGSSTSWTIEFWGYVGASFGTYCPMSFVQDGTNRWGIEIGASSTNVVFGTPGSTSFTHPSSLSTSTWFHFALVRDGSTVKLYINGTASSSTSSFNLQSLSSSAVLFVGRNNVSGFFFDWNGYIDDLRITNGFARYTADFTPPTAAFPLQ
jgi:hypothetical protein